MKQVKLIAIGVCLMAGLMFAVPHSVHPAPVPQGGSNSQPFPPPPPPPPSPRVPENDGNSSSSGSLLGKLLKVLVG